jgi:hypothetical protein
MEKTREIPIEEWFIFNEQEVNKFFQKIIREINWYQLGDSFNHLNRYLIPELVRRIHKCAFEFHFEPDRGRPNLGYTFRLYLEGTIVQLGSDKEYFLSKNIDDLKSSDLVDAMKCMLIADVLEM